MNIDEQESIYNQERRRRDQQAASEQAISSENNCRLPALPPYKYLAAVQVIFIQ